MNHLIEFCGLYNFLIDHNAISVKPKYDGIIRSTIHKRSMYKDAISVFIHKAINELSPDKVPIWYNDINIDDITETKYHYIAQDIDKNTIKDFGKLIGTIFDTVELYSFLKTMNRDYMTAFSGTYVFHIRWECIDVSKTLPPEQLDTVSGRFAIKHDSDLSLYENTKKLLGEHND